MKECTTFQALLKPLTKNLMQAAVKQHNSDNYFKKFKTWDHLIIMIYSQLYEIKSLRDLEISFNSQKNLRAIMHCKKMVRSSLSDANSSRSAECFLWIAEQLMGQLPRKKRKEINKIVRKIDSSPIQLKGKGYEWTIANRTLRCQGLKLHVEYDGEIKMPIGTKITRANADDCSVGQQWPIKANVIYVFDKGYYDYNWWWSINQKNAFFVTRLKTNAGIKIIENAPINNEKILEDTFIRFESKSHRKNLYVTPLRRVVVKRDGKEKPLVIVTNLMDTHAEIIAELYKERWGIELFFKWIKQNLKIKKFLGKSENAVKIQLATALITYLLIGLFKIASKNKLSLHQLLIWIKHNCNIKKRIYKVMKPPEYEFPIYDFALHVSGGKI
jgi:putative transposase